MFLTPIDTTQKVLVVRGIASQSGSLQEWQNSTGSTYATINNLGTFLSSGGATIYANGEVGGQTTSARITAPFANVSPLHLRGAASQTGDLTQWQDSTGSVLAAVSSSGALQSSIANFNFIRSYGSSPTVNRLDFNSNSYSALLYSVAAGSTGLIVKGAASQTANLQEWQNSSGFAAAKVSATGSLYGQDVQVFGGRYGTAMLSVNTGDAGNPGIVVRAMASQTADLLQFQNSAGTVLAKIGFGGDVATTQDLVFGTVGTVLHNPLSSFSNMGGALTQDTQFGVIRLIYDHPTTRQSFALTSYLNGNTPQDLFSVSSTGAGLFTARAAGTVPLAVKGAVSQTADLQQWQNSSGGVVARVGAAGLIETNDSLKVGFGSLPANTQAFIKPQLASSTALVIQAQTSQSAEIFQVQDSSGSAVAGVTAAGRLYSGFSLGAQLDVKTMSDSRVGAIIRANSGTQTANLLELQDSTGLVNSAFNSTGAQLTLGRVASSGTVTQGKLLFSDGTTDNFGLTLQSATLTANRTYSFPNSSAATDTVCLLTLANCGAGGGGGWTDDGAVVRLSTASDSVGIGITNPGTKLVVSDTSAGSTISLMRLQNLGNTANTASRLLFTTSDSASNLIDIAGVTGLLTDPTDGSEDGDLLFGTTQNAVFGERMRITSAGVVRIAGLLNCNTIDTDGSGNLACGTDEGGAGSAGGWTDDGTVVRLSTATDFVGIGTASPNYPLHIHQATSDSGPIQQFTNTDTGTTIADGFLVGLSTAEHMMLWNREATSILFATSNTERASISSTGVLRVNALTNNNGVLYTDGSGNISQTATGGAGTLCLVSTAGGAPTFGSCSGSASTAWSSLTAPTTALSLNMGAHQTAFTWNGANNEFGSLHLINNGTSASGGNIGLRLTGTQSVANTGYYYGMYAAPQYTGAGTMTDFIGLSGSPFNNGTGTITNLYGSRNDAGNSTGTTTNLYEFYGAPSNGNGTATITNAYTLFSAPTNGTGTISNLYGAYFKAPTNSGTITNKYAFVSEAGAGNVGIGTVSPTEKLHISGAGTQRLMVTETGSAVNTKIVSSTTNGYIGTSSNHALRLGAFDGDAITILPGGNVGIGTITPGTTTFGDVLTGLSLHLENASANTNLILSGDDPTMTFINRGDGANVRRMRTTYAGDDFIFASLNDNATVRKDNILVVDGGGNVGIGTNNPLVNLHVRSSTVGGGAYSVVSNLDNTTWMGQWGGSSFASPAIYYSSLGLRFGKSTGADSSGFTEQLGFSGTGAVRFNTYGAGTLVTDSSGNITASSDEQLKDVQGNFSRGLSDILALDPVLYKWNGTSGMETSGTYAGFTAQNVQGAIPEAVGTDSRGYLTLQDRPILAATVNAIKELNTKLTDMDARLTQVEALVGQSNSANFASLNVSGPTTLADLTVTGTATFQGKLVVEGHITVGKDTAGTAVIPAGETEVSITFENPYGLVPKITANADDFVAIKLSDKTINGFKVKLQTALAYDVSIDWIALEPSE